MVQRQDEGIRLIRQHDHALASGTLAHLWANRLPHRLVLAVSLHDVAWRPLDRRPRRHPDTGRPCGFVEHPLPEKLEAYRAGLDEMEAVDPWVGLLGSLHYSSFLEEGEARGFLAHEEERRARLREELELRARGPGDREAIRDRAGHQLRWLKFFDGLSLRICLTPPVVPRDAVPAWLDPEGPVRPPEGRALDLEWRTPGRLAVRPWPFAGRRLRLELPWRELPGDPFPDDAALRRAWEDAERGVWRPELVRGGGAR